MVPELIKGNYYAHIVHNCMKHAMNFLSYDIENVILKIYSHFSHSAVRREELKKFIDMVDGDFYELKRHVGTRWLSLLPCIDTILLNWKAIKNYFVSLGEECPMLLQNLLMLNSTHDLIEIYLHFGSHILHVFNNTVKCLEGNFITILDVYNIMNTLKKELTKRKEDLFFGYETGKKIKELELSSPEITNKIYINFSLFIDKSLCYLKKWFNFSNTNWLFSLNNFNLKTQIKYEHFVNIIESLNLQKLNINMDNLYSKILVMNELLAKIIDCKDFTDINIITAQKWQYIFNRCDDFPNIYKVILYLLSVPAISAFTERVFSVV